MSHKTLALLCFSDKDRTVVVSLLNLLSGKMLNAWRIDDAAAHPDRLLIDMDGEAGMAAWKSHAADGHRRVAVYTQTHPSDANALMPKPIRARDLIHALESTADASPPAPSDTGPAHGGDDSVIRLRRWPDALFLRGHPELTRLCALLMRHPIPVSRLPEAAGTTPDIVRQFIKLCGDNGWLSTETPAQAVPAPRTPNHELHGFFARIRAGLGL